MTDKIDIEIEDYQQSMEKQLSSNSKEDEEEGNLESSTTAMLLKITSNSDDGFDDFEGTDVEKVCNSCIESKYTKIVRHKKMTPTLCKLQEIHANLWELHDSALLLGIIYIRVLLDEYTRKS